MQAKINQSFFLILNFNKIFYHHYWLVCVYFQCSLYLCLVCFEWKSNLIFLCNLWAIKSSQFNASKNKQIKRNRISSSFKKNYQTIVCFPSFFSVLFEDYLLELISFLYVLFYTILFYYLFVVFLQIHFLD